VGREDEPTPAEEVLDLGVLDEPASGTADPAREPSASPRPPTSRRALLVVGGLVAVAGGLAVTVSRRSGTPPTTPPTPTPSAAVRPSPSGAARPTPSPSPPMAVTELGHPLLAVTAGWDLFALGDEVLVRIHLASGRITRTALPPLGDGGVSLVPARSRLLIHPPDFRQGYVVPDDRPVTEMPPSMNGAGPMLPGPDPDHVWVQSVAGQMSLVTLSGKLTGLNVTVPLYLGPGMPDGAGYLLFEGVGGVYKGGRAGISRITTGVLVAVGPTGLLTVDCDDRAQCNTTLRGRDGRTSVVPATLQPQGPSPGAISPDGTAVVVYAYGQAGDVSATMVDLDNGATHTIDLPLDPRGAEGTVVWSPDGRWLFVVDSMSQLKVIDARTRAVSDVVPGLPPVGQLVVRP
jgi:hypothetical protein